VKKTLAEVYASPERVRFVVTERVPQRRFMPGNKATIHEFQRGPF
jgi:hypothetical protein